MRSDEVIVPRTQYYSILGRPKINNVFSEENGAVKNGWRCDWCVNLPAMFALVCCKLGWATKLLN